MCDNASMAREVIGLFLRSLENDYQQRLRDDEPLLLLRDDELLLRDDELRARFEVYGIRRRMRRALSAHRVPRSRCPRGTSSGLRGCSSRHR